MVAADPPHRSLNHFSPTEVKSMGTAAPAIPCPSISFRRRPATGADRLFAIPEENLRGVPRSVMEELNLFLRAHSTVGTEEGFIHGHTFRHACQSWMFTAMMLAAGNIAQSPFKDLPLTSAWLALKSERSKALWGHDNPTAKQPTCRRLRQAMANSSQPPAPTYTSSKWVLALFLDASQAMQPSDRLAQKRHPQYCGTKAVRPLQRGGGKSPGN